MQVPDDSRQPGRRAAVFGATGGIGRALVAALAVEGRDVVALSRSGERVPGASLALRADVTDEASIAGAADTLRDEPPELVIVATGVLTLADGTGATGMRPERSYRQIDAEAMMEVLRINTVGPALVAKHMLPLYPCDRAGVFAALGARVGSIGDNRLGGWHSYRASKAALAMLIRNFALEVRRTHPGLIVLGLHPGTVDTPLSAPFQTNLPAGQLQDADAAARRLLRVIATATQRQSGLVLDWRGETVPA